VGAIQNSGEHEHAALKYGRPEYIHMRKNIGEYSNNRAQTYSEEGVKIGMEAWS
jgi:hypothetical protein